MPGDIAVGEARPDRRRCADPDRSGREVDGVRVLRPARIALEPAERAQLRQVAPVEPPQQVVDRVEDRRGMGLHRDPVRRPHVLELERRS